LANGTLVNGDPYLTNNTVAAALFGTGLGTSRLVAKGACSNLPSPHHGPGCGDGDRQDSIPSTIVDVTAAASLTKLATVAGLTPTGIQRTWSGPNPTS